MRPRNSAPCTAKAPAISKTSCRNRAELERTVADSFQLSKGRKVRERFVRGLTFLCALISVLTTIGIVYVLVSESIPFFQQVSIWEYLTGTHWSPRESTNPSFGILPLL